MKRFRFELESVRSLREQAEDHARESLARELATHAQLEAALAGVAAEIQAVRCAGAPAPGASVAAGDLRARERYLERRERERAAAERQLSEHEGVVELRRAHFERAAREHESVERLRERALARHLDGVRRQQDALADELATTAYARGLRAASR